jgi:hypothetical protein
MHFKSGGSDECAVEIIERQGILISVLQMPGIAAMVPLEPGSSPPSVDELKEPEYHTAWAKC